MSFAVVFKLVLLLTFPNGDVIEAWNYEFSTEAECLSAGNKFQELYNKQENPSGFDLTLNFECLSKGSVGKKITASTKIKSSWR